MLKIFSIICVILLIPAVCYPETVDEAASKIHSPEELSQWYSREFYAEIKTPDFEQSPEETLQLKRGDCDDFARLSHAILEKIGIDCQVIIIKFEDLKIHHAICAWKDGKHYNFMENEKFIRTRTSTIDDLIKTYYSDSECCTACTAILENGRCIKINGK